MNETDSQAPTVTVTLSEVETKVLEWAVQAYRDSAGGSADVDALATQLRGLSVGFAARRASERSKPSS
jgi:hypothetical protein